METRSSRSHGVLQQPEHAENGKGKKGDYQSLQARCGYEEYKGALVPEYGITIRST